MRVLHSKSLLFDVYGGFVRQLGGWIAVADLVSLLADLGIDEQAVRSSVSRFTRKGLLERATRDGQVGYALSDRAVDILEEGDLRIYDRVEPAQVADGWVLATFSVPEGLRADRHQLRSRLTWLGFGNLGAGLWIAPRRVLERTETLVADLRLERYVDLFEAHYRAFDDLEALVERCWDVERMRKLYTAFLGEFEPVLERWTDRDPAADPREAFVDYVTALHEWRKMPYVDPGLPPELLPDGWEGTAAANLFAELRANLEAAARSHVEEVVRA
jgi:phenylacetic acid degradation operon negative regulatory protein